MPADWLAKSGIKFVELGVESYNDPVLKAVHKPATESMINQVVDKLRQNHIALIPNIIIGHPLETAETYAHTLKFLRDNKDIISHANIYNLALYKDTELGKQVIAGADGDFNENVLEKSFHTNPEIHRQFAGDVYGLASEMLSGKPSEAQFQAPREEGEPEYPPKGAKIYPAGELNHRAQQLQNQVAMGKKTLQRAEDEISYLTAGRDFERYPVEQELQRKLQAHEISAEEHRHQLKVLDAGLDQKYKQADTIETWISNQWHIPQKGDPGWIPPPIVQGRNTEAESAGPSDQESWGQFPTQFQPQKGKFTLGSTDDDLTVRGKVFTKGPRAPVHESTPGVAGDTNWRYDHDTRALFTWGDSEESDPEVLAETEAWLKKRGLPVDEVQSLSEFDDPDGYHYNRAHFGSQFQPKPLEEGVQNLDDLPDTKEALFPSASAPVHAAVPEVSKLVNEATTLPPDQWNEMASAYSGGVSAYSHKVGMAVKSQADLLALRNAHGALNGLVEPAITAGDMDLAMALASKTQALREAYESATGRTMDGTKDTIATTRKIVDPNYQPPLPPPGAQFQAATKAGQDLEDKGFQLVSDDYGPGTGLVIRKVMKDDKEVASIQITQTSPDEARVNMVKVDPAYRNQGMAETLYREAATELQARGVTKLSGNVIHPAPLAIRAKLFGGPGRRGQNAWGAQSRNVEHNIPADVQFEPAKEESEGFKKWTKGAMIIPADNPAIHDVQTGKPVVVTGYHGTTRDFSVFDPNRGEAEGHFGKGIYVTTSQEDAKQNYAGFGPDLRNKIDREAERMAGADPADLMREYGVSKKVAERATGSGEENQTALRLAKKKFASHGGATMKVFVKLENPLVLGGKGEPFWDLTYDETTGQETGKLADLLEALNDSAASYGSRGFPMPEEFIDGGKASQVIDALRKSDELMQITDDRGDLVGPELIRDAIQRMGYDGIVDRTVDQNFGSQLRIGGKPVGMMGMNPDTAHIVAFKPEQVKSATGNRGTFDPTNPDIQYQPKTYIVRHGSTEMNADDTSKDKIRGFLNIPLSDKGKKEASALAEGLTGSGITTIITSDLKRAKQTADAIAKTTDAKVVEEPGLRPWHFGPTIEGKPTDDMLPVIKNLVEHPDEVPKGGESFNTFKDRFIGAFHEAQDKYPDETTALVTHYRGTKLLDAWRAEGVDNDAISREVFEAFDKDKKPATYDVVDKTGAQFQGAKREDPQSKENSRVYEKRSATHGWWMNSQGNLLPLTTGEHATDAIKILGIPASRQEKNDAYGQTALKAYHELTKRGWRAILPQTFFRSGQPVSTLLYRGGEETPEAAAATINKAQRNALERLAIKHDLVINNNLGDSIYRPPNTPASGEEPPMMGQAQYQAPFKHADFDKELEKMRSGVSGGATFSPSGEIWNPSEKKVDLVSLASVNLPLGDLTRENVSKALGKFSDLLDEPGIVAGSYAFSKEGKPTASVDLNAVVPKKYRDNTLDFAKQNDQVAIWDVEHSKEVLAGGKGNTRLQSVGEILDALNDLHKGKPVDVDEILRQNRETGAPAEEPGLPGMKVGRKPLSTHALSNMTKADIAAHFPESVIPRTRNEPISSDITSSPLFKAAGNPEAAAKSFGRKLTEFAKEWLDHPSFQSGLKWYSEFVPQLKAKFGEHAPLMAELLAGTSPNEQPANNYAMALDALEGFKAGRFAKQIAKFEEGADKFKDGSWKRWIDRELAAGKVKDVPETPTQETFINHWVDKYDLKPKKANGKLYGISSDAVLKILARKWLANTPGLKTQNFVQNLLGTGHEATIDLWADRTMRRIGYSGSKARWRILPKNVTGVSDADFKFSQAAFRQAAKELGMTPDALQGGLWFAEKQLWADNGWGRLDLGDYRNEIAKTDLLKKGLQQVAATKKAVGKAHPAEQPEFLVTPRNLKQ
jgi:broad specificity phosphatase PhoE/GNAT superfamily N-acetyltransferase